MKKSALILALLAIPTSMTFAFDLFQEDGLRRVNDYSLTVKPSYERIRAQDFVPAVLESEGPNKTLKANVGDAQLKKTPGVVFGRDCIRWRMCLQRTVKKTGYDSSLRKRSRARVGEMSTLGYDVYAYKKRQAALNSDVDGKTKLINLLSIMRKNQRGTK